MEKYYKLPELTFRFPFHFVWNFLLLFASWRPSPSILSSWLHSFFAFTCLKCQIPQHSHFKWSEWMKIKKRTFSCTIKITHKKKLSRKIFFFLLVLSIGAVPTASESKRENLQFFLWMESSHLNLVWSERQIYNDKWHRLEGNEQKRSLDDGCWGSVESMKNTPFAVMGVGNCMHAPSNIGALGGSTHTLAHSDRFRHLFFFFLLRLVDSSVNFSSSFLIIGTSESWNCPFGVLWGVE